MFPNTKVSHGGQSKNLDKTISKNIQPLFGADKTTKERYNFT